MLISVIVMLALVTTACAPKAATPTPATPSTKQQMAEAAKTEGQIISYGMSDDWVNLGKMWRTFEQRYGVKHADTDMTSAEQITRLLAEKDAPVKVRGLGPQLRTIHSRCR